MLLQFGLELFDVVDLVLLLFQLVFGRFQLLVLISKTVYFRFEFVRLLFFNSFDVALGDLLDL